MTLRTLLFASILVCAPSLVSAQSPEIELVTATDSADDLPSYDASIGLHVTAISLAVIGSGAILSLPISIATCTPENDACGFAPSIAAFAGGLVALVGIGFGIAASVVHAITRSARPAPRRTAWLPLPWADARGGGLALRFEL